MSEQPGVTLVPLGAPRGRRAWTIRHAGRSYSVFDVAGELQVTDAACPHNGGPLAKGVVRDGVVTCPWHWYSFELSSGICRTAAGYRLRKYPVIQRGGRSYVELPDVTRRFTWSQLLRPRARPGHVSGSTNPANPEQQG
jgi:nitrite reductase/ring-hydroxylating ferredoxin subunit